jgi:hypothetical protein
MDSKIEYAFVEDVTIDPTQNCPIKITAGPYKDIIFRFGKISLKEDSDDLHVNMEIDIVNAPENFNKEEQNFTNTVGEIFVQIVESGVEPKKPDPVDLEDDVHQDQ